MKNLSALILACLLSAAIAYCVSQSKNPLSSQTATQTSTLDRILATKTLRCGYVPYNPLIIKDPATGEITGIGADIHKYIADVLGVKLEWTAEASWSTYLEDLKMGRYDMLCDMDFWFPPYAGQLATNTPVLYTIVSGWTRPENAARFLGKPLDQFNAPDITVSAIDGTIPMMVAAHDFPKAKLLSMPAMTDYTFNITNVVDRKADITFVENVFAEAFLKTHPGALVNVTPNAPVRVYAYSVPTLMGDVKMKSTMENIIGYMIDNGVIDDILRKYGADKGYYVAERPHRAVK